MKKVLISILNSPWYFVFLAAYPVLALLSHNISQVRYTIGIRPLIFNVVTALALFGLFWLIYRQLHRAAIATAIFTVLFFTYGQVIDYIQQNMNVKLPAWLGLFWLVLTVLGLLLAGWRKVDFGKGALALNVISLGLVVYVIFQISSSIPKGNPSILPVDGQAPIQTLHLPQGTTPPDIYYFILDSYGRSDLLMENLGIDNSGFIADLEKNGFYVAKCSQSNYPRTDVSLGSSLNLDYLQDLNAAFVPSNENRFYLWQSILDSTARYELEQAGYKTVAFATGFAFTEITSADVYLAPSPVWSPLDEFEVLLMQTTPLRHLQDLGLVNLTQVDGQRYRDRTELVLNSMKSVAQMKGPKFVFVHLVIPHPLFVFAPDGSPTDPSQFMDENGIYSQANYYRGYKNQTAYIDDQMEKVIQTLQSNSTTPPVIVIQGDHAPWLQSGSDQFKILNAYYFPGHKNVLYPSISPVNTFRLIFNTYLGANYSLLKDLSYDSPVPNVFDFSQDSNFCPGK